MFVPGAMDEKKEEEEEKKEEAPAEGEQNLRNTILLKSK